MTTITKADNIKKIANLFALSIIIAIAFSLAVRCIIFFLPDVVSAFDEEIGRVFFAFKKADVDVAWLVSLPCGMILSLFETLILYKRKPLKIMIGILFGFVFSVISVFLVLWNTRINQVPFSTFVKVASELVAYL